MFSWFISLLLLFGYQVSIKKWTRNINLAYARIRLAVDQADPRIDTEHRGAAQF